MALWGDPPPLGIDPEPIVCLPSRGCQGPRLIVAENVAGKLTPRTRVVAYTAASKWRRDC